MTNYEREHVRALLGEYSMTHDRALRNELVQYYLYIAEITARRFSGRGVEYDDLFQIASLALITALDRYDCARCVEFQTYATSTVVGEVKHYFRDKLRLARPPRRTTEAFKKIDAARERLTHDLGRNPTTAEIADAMKLPLETVVEVMDSRMAGYGVSLDDDLLDRNDSGFDSVEMRDYLNRELEKLDETERKVIISRFVKERSQREVAIECGVSQASIWRLERRVLERMRAAYRT